MSFSKLALCPSCKTFVPFRTIHTTTTKFYHNQKIQYPTSTAQCLICQTEATFPPYTEQNGQAFNDAVALANNLITKQQIKTILKNYNNDINKISKITNISEQNLTSIINGVCPSPEHSKKLQTLI